MEQCDSGMCHAWQLHNICNMDFFLPMPSHWPEGFEGQNLPRACRYFFGRAPTCWCGRGFQALSVSQDIASVSP